MNYKAQGAIEYLLLLAAAVVVVAVVVSFMISTIQQGQGSGSQATYDYTCKTLDTNNFVCGCYLCDSKKAGIYEPTGSIEHANKAKCNTLSISKNDTLISGDKCGAGLP